MGKKQKLFGEYKTPSKATNYKAFDYANYLKTKNIYGTVTVSKITKESEKTYLNPLLIISNNIKQKIEKNLDEILGEDSYLVKRNTTSEIQKEYQRKQQKILEQVAYIIFQQYLVHTFGFILIGLTTLLSKLKASKPKINAINSIFLIILMFITGFTTSVVRACIMAELGIVSKILHKKNNILNNLCISLLITLIYNPYNLQNNSVLLSYGGVIRNNSLSKADKKLDR